MYAVKTPSKTGFSGYFVPSVQAALSYRRNIDDIFRRVVLWSTKVLNNNNNNNNNDDIYSAVMTTSLREFTRFI